MLIIIIIIIFLIIVFLYQTKVHKEKTQVSLHHTIRAKNLEYEELRCETDLNNRRQYSSELLFSHCKICCNEDSVFIFDNDASPVIVRKRLRKVNSDYVLTPTYLNMDSFGNAVHMEFELGNDRKSFGDVTYTIRLFDVSDIMKERIRVALET